MLTIGTLRLSIPKDTPGETMFQFSFSPDAQTIFYDDQRGSTYFLKSGSAVTFMAVSQTWVGAGGIFLALSGVVLLALAHGAMMRRRRNRQ
jgi:hypothetical protein